MIKRLALISLVGLNACEANTAPVEGGFPDGSSTGGFAGTVVSEPGFGGGFATGGVAGFGATPFTDPVVVADPPPPPISGGTLLVSSTERWAAVSDPDRDQLLIVNLDEAKVTGEIALEPGDEPGRLVEDGAGQLHVVLRGGGGIATVDPATGTLIERRAVCAYPRGLAYDPTADALYVACAEGTLVTMPAAGGEATRSVTLDRDLRDVVVENGHLWVSVFRSAEVLELDAQGLVSARHRPPPMKSGETPLSEARVAWRMVPDPLGGVLVLHQREQLGEIVIQPGGYGVGVGCGGIVEGAVSHIESGQPPESSSVGVFSTLSVDLAVAGDEMLMASAGAVANPQLGSFFPTVPRLLRGDVMLSDAPEFAGCSFPTSALGTLTVNGQAVAVGYDGTTPVIQLREPSLLIIGDKAVTLPGDSRLDTGHLLFHAATSSGLACASCHPEGREDGHTWTFSGIGPRRTQSIGGMLEGTAPFHWGGDEATFDALVTDVMTVRMMGPSLSQAHSVALQDWIDSIPAWVTPPSADDAAIERGRALFESQGVACSTCHAGEKLTNNASYDVGTGATLQVPSLRGVAWRAPFLHTGCANTLQDRFGPCGGNLHGDVHMLTDTDLGDLVAYLESL